MTRETKVGLMMVALLVGVFGFLVYKRIHRPLEGLANQEATESHATDRDFPAQPNDVTSRRDDSDPISQAKPRTKGNDRAAAFQSHVEDEFSSTLTATDDSQFEEPSPVRQRLKPPPIEKSEDDSFDQFNEKQVTKKTTPRQLPLEPAENTFDDLPPVKQKSLRNVIQVAAASDADPFGSEESASTENDRQTPFAQTDDQNSPLPAPDPIEDDLESNESSFEPPRTERVGTMKEPRRVDLMNVPDPSPGQRPSGLRNSRPGSVQQTSDFENGLEPAPRDSRRAAPVTLEDRSFSPEGTPRKTVSGPSYVIEPNDNFWSISRKRYGVGRYYMALARHNQQVIPDPKRMKPGVAISTPDASLLEQRYAELIPKPAPADPAPAVATTQSRKSEEAGPGGFFVSPDGVPMYRITGQDTLSDIAKSHLGRSSRWVQILEMNRNVLRDGNELKIGTVLKLPADASRVQVVGTPRNFR